MALLCPRQFGLVELLLTAPVMAVLSCSLFGPLSLCWAAVTPGDPYPTAEGPGQAVHGSSHGSP